MNSVLNLCRGHIEGKTLPGLPADLKVSERKITMGDLVEAEKNGSLLEVFGAGTAAIVSAVDKWVAPLCFLYFLSSPNSIPPRGAPRRLRIQQALTRQDRLRGTRYPHAYRPRGNGPDRQGHVRYYRWNPDWRDRIRLERGRQ